MVNMVRVGVVQTRGIVRVEMMRYGCIVWLCVSMVCGGRYRMLGKVSCVLDKMA